MEVNQHLFFKWWNLVSFYMSLSYLKTLILMREKMVPRLLSVYNRLKFSTSSGLILLTELLPIVSFGKLLTGDFLLLFNKLQSPFATPILFMCSQFSKMTSFGGRQIRSLGTRILMISHLDFFFFNPNIK